MTLVSGTLNEFLELNFTLTSNNDPEEVKSDVVFKVQLAASSKDLALKPYNFNGLRGLSKAKSGKIYRYFTGETSSFSEIKIIRESAVSKGYTSAFIVAYKDGKKIPLSEAIKKD